MTRQATTSQTFRACQGMVSASRATVDERFDQRHEALGGLIAAAENSDVDQWYQERDESPGMRDYVHVSLPPTTRKSGPVAKRGFLGVHWWVDMKKLG